MNTDAVFLISHEIDHINRNIMILKIRGMPDSNGRVLPADPPPRKREVPIQGGLPADPPSCDRRHGIHGSRGQGHTVLHLRGAGDGPAHQATGASPRRAERDLHPGDHVRHRLHPR